MEGRSAAVSETPGRACGAARSSRAGRVGSGSGGFVAPQVSRVPGPLAFVPSGQGPAAALLLLLLPLCLLEAERGQLCGGRAGGRGVNAPSARRARPVGRPGRPFLLHGPKQRPGPDPRCRWCSAGQLLDPGTLTFLCREGKNPQTCAERQRTIIRSPIPGGFSRRFILFHMHFRLSVVFSYALWLANAVLRFKKKKMTL